MNTAIPQGIGGYLNHSVNSYNRIGKSPESADALQSMRAYAGSQKDQASFSSRKNNDAARAAKAQQDKIAQMKKMIRGEDKKKNPYGMNGVLESLQSYSESLKASRETAKDSATQVKQLRYNFKDISGQIRRSKTSANAKQVASKARREVVMLKLKKQSGQYDDEEISAAITHAQAMERAAKKKARHLMEEELVKITDDAPSQRDKINLEEQMESERDKMLEEIDKETQAAEEKLSELSEEEMAKMQEAMEESMEETQEMMQESMEEMSSEMLDEMSQAMQDLMEDTFSDMMDSMFSITDFEMTEDDFKELVKKHRTSEDKDMVKADMDYLKSLFDHYNKMLHDGGGATAASPQAAAVSAPMAMPAVSANVSIPEGGVVDVSV